MAERGYLDAPALEQMRSRFERLFDGEYETGIEPDEVKWVLDPVDVTRQMCNTWKSDRMFTRHLPSERTGRFEAFDSNGRIHERHGSG